MMRTQVGAVAFVLAALFASDARASRTGDALIAYVKSHRSNVDCAERTLAEGQFVHCRSSSDCQVPNLIFEVRGPGAVWVNGKTQTFIETNTRHPVPIQDGRPLPYSVMDILKSLGCPGR